MTTRNDVPVKILGFSISKEKYPTMYQWAKSNSMTLEEMLKKMVEVERETGNPAFNVASAVIILESDLL